ncbi:hypothetical protein [Streptomyces sp. URMC 123]|uniref:hypothetical protein n=1 Tax=Streptomyces sp. URMC 123 TaxID=3423403 RepID=UPI003F1C6CA9
MSTSPATVREQSSTASTLARMLTELPGLPAADYSVGTLVTPTQVVRGIGIALHGPGSFQAFETWREALNIAVDQVDHRENAGGGYQVLSALGSYADVPVHLHAFANR